MFEYLLWTSLWLSKLASSSDSTLWDAGGHRGMLVNATGITGAESGGPLLHQACHGIIPVPLQMVSPYPVISDLMSALLRVALRNTNLKTPAVKVLMKQTLSKAKK